LRGQIVAVYASWRVAFCWLQSKKIKMTSEFKKTVHYKIKLFKDLLGENAYYVNNNEVYLAGTKATMKFQDGNFRIEVIASNHPSKEEFDDPFKLLNGEIELEKNSKKYTIDVEHIDSMSQTFSDPFIASYTAKQFTINRDKFSEELCHTLLIPIDKEQFFSTYSMISVKIGAILHYKFFDISIDSIDYHIFCHTNDDLDEAYLFIESMQKIRLEDFENISRSILLMIGISYGNLYNGTHFIYSYEDFDEWSDFDAAKLTILNDSIVTDYELCNITECRQYLEHIGQKEMSNKACSRISKYLLSRMIKEISENIKIQRVIELILEATQSNSIVLKASIYSVALETLANINYKEKKERLNPIDDHELAMKIEGKFIDILNEYDTFISEDGLRIYTKKVKSLNTPANMDRLTQAFVSQGMTLTKHDQDSLKGRNKFLHGSTPFRNFEGNKIKKKELNLMITKLRFLSTSLLMKTIGYSGHLKNNYGKSKAYETMKIQEHIFRFI
jgi:hypothetical protein